jgi:hypothetical protein
MRMIIQREKEDDDDDDPEQVEEEDDDDDDWWMMMMMMLVPCPRCCRTWALGFMSCILDLRRSKGREKKEHENPAIAAESRLVATDGFDRSTSCDVNHQQNHEKNGAIWGSFVVSQPCNSTDAVFVTPLIDANPC